MPVPLNPWQIDQDTPAKQRLEQYATTLELNYDLGFASLKSITAYNLFDVYRFGDSDFTQYALRTVEQISHNETTTQELQLASSRPGPSSGSSAASSCGRTLPKTSSSSA